MLQGIEHVGIHIPQARLAVFPGFSGAAKGSRRRAHVEEEGEVLGTHSDWCPSVQMFHSLTMLKEVNSPSRRHPPSFCCGRRAANPTHELGHVENSVCLCSALGPQHQATPGASVVVCTL